MMKKTFLAVLVAVVAFSGLAGSAQAAPVLGTKKVGVVLFNFLNNPNDRPITADAIRQQIFSTNGDTVKNYIKEASYNLVDIVGKNNPAGDVFGWYTIGHFYNATVCQSLPSIFSSAATINAFFSGVDLTGYDFLFFVFATPEGCTPPVWNGLTGNGEAWISARAIASQSQPRTLGHEFVHGLGVLWHTNSYDCRENNVYVPLSKPENCLFKEYGDYTTILGNYGSTASEPAGMYHLNALHKLFLGWLGGSKLSIAGATGDFEIRPVEKLYTDVSVDKKLLVVPNFSPATSAGFTAPVSLFADYRQPIGFDARGIFGTDYGGVRLYLASQNLLTGGQTYAISGPSSIWLMPGTSVTAPDTGITIKTLSASADLAKIRVEFPEVNIISPVGGATVSGAIPVSIKANGAFDKLVLRGDNFLLTQFDYNPNNPVYNYTWNASNLSAGTHQIKATITNNAGTTLAEHVVTVTKENPAIPASISIEKVAYNASGALNFNGIGILRVNLSGDLRSPKLFIDNHEVTIQPVVDSNNMSYVWWGKISDIGHGLKTVRATALTPSGTSVSSETQFFFNDLSIGISAPTAGTKISGIWGISVRKTRGELNRFNFFVDGRLTGDGDLLDFNFNTKEFPNGPHTLSIKAFGREAEVDAHATPFPSQPLVVYFNNACATATRPCEEESGQSTGDSVGPSIEILAPVTRITVPQGGSVNVSMSMSASDPSLVAESGILLAPHGATDLSGVFVVVRCLFPNASLCSRSVPMTLSDMADNYLHFVSWDASPNRNYSAKSLEFVPVQEPGGRVIPGQFALRPVSSGEPLAPVSNHEASLRFTTTPPFIKLGQSSTLSWQSSGVTSCTARSLPAGVWSGTQAVSGTKSLTPTAPGFHTFYLDCRNQNSSQTITRTATLRVDYGWVELKANGQQSLIARPAQNVTLSWTSDKVTTCEASDAWSGTKPATGSATVMPSVRRSVYRLICTGPGGAVAGAQAIVTLSSTISHLASSTNLPTQNTSSPLTLRWQTTDVPSTASIKATLVEKNDSSSTILLGANDGAQTVVLPNTLPSGEYRLYLSATFDINNTPVTIDQRDLGGAYSKPLSFTVNNAAIPPSSGGGQHSPASGGNNQPPSGSSGQDSGSGSDNPPSSPPASPPPPPPAPPSGNYVITIDAPRAGDSWRLGEQRDIRWRDDGPAGATYQISLHLPNGSVTSLAQTSEKRYRWTVGPQAGSGYQVSVTRADGAGQATSGSFTIAPSSHSFLINTPQLASVSSATSPSVSLWLRGLFPQLFP